MSEREPQIRTRIVESIGEEESEVVISLELEDEDSGEPAGKVVPLRKEPPVK